MPSPRYRWGSLFFIQDVTDRIDYLRFLLNYRTVPEKLVHVPLNLMLYLTPSYATDGGSCLTDLDLGKNSGCCTSNSTCCIGDICCCDQNCYDFGDCCLDVWALECPPRDDQTPIPESLCKLSQTVNFAALNWLKYS